ncbi:MAG: hypothetical protein JWO63_1199 [Frankiales bacterium]|jgi:hypothetical protein|nr:hypothetical protein [Frankiales bacterium]
MAPDSGVRIGPEVTASLTDDDPLPANAPAIFRTAIDTLLATAVRREAVIERIRPPQRLAPWSFAIAVDIDGRDANEGSTGRLVVLHDPDGAEAWDGETRLVAYAQSDLAADMAGDPLLPAVGWSWLTESLSQRQAAHTAVGGTVTQTTSTRFGDVHGPRSTTQLELRGSWTALDSDLSAHLLAFVDLLSTAAGLPPEGVATLGDR